MLACVHILVRLAAKLFSSRVARGHRRSRCSPPQCPNICSQLEAAAKLTFSTTHGPSLSPSRFFFFFTLSLFQSVRPSSLLFPSHPTTSSPTDPQHPPHRLQLAPASLPAFWRGFTLLRLWVGEGCCQEAAGKRTCLEPLWEA